MWFLERFSAIPVSFSSTAFLSIYPCGPEEQSEQDNAYYIQSNYTAVYAVYEQHVQPNRECYNFKERSLGKHT